MAGFDYAIIEHFSNELGNCDFLVVVVSIGFNIDRLYVGKEVNVVVMGTRRGSSLGLRNMFGNDRRIFWISNGRCMRSLGDGVVGRGLADIAFCSEVIERIWQEAMECV